MNVLTPDDLAELLGLKRKTVIDIYSKQKGFPSPLSQRKPRWLETEVMKFWNGLQTTGSVIKEEEPEQPLTNSLERTKITTNFADFMESVRGAKRRATRKGREFTIDYQSAYNLWLRCDGKCEITGIPFDFTKLINQKARPFSPSIDRIDNSKGYELENVRVVCIAVNVAMNQWGESVLYKIAASLNGRSPNV